MILQAEIGSRIYRIEDDLPTVGAYLRVFEAGKDLYDYLQDDQLKCKHFATEEFGVPFDAWREVPE